jgi:hypothetical protein
MLGIVSFDSCAFLDEPLDEALSGCSVAVKATGFDVVPQLVEKYVVELGAL